MGFVILGLQVGEINVIKKIVSVAGWLNREREFNHFSLVAQANISVQVFLGWFKNIYIFYFIFWNLWNLILWNALFENYLFYKCYFCNIIQIYYLVS